MSESIAPYDLGKFQIVENYQKISIDQLVRQVHKTLKIRLLESQINALGISLKLMTTHTRFQGERVWFACPLCNRRVGTLFYDSMKNNIGCRKCLHLSYRKQRFKGMIESDQLD